MGDAIKDDIFFKKSRVHGLQEYVALYQKCFPRAVHLNVDYLKWLYQDNPSGHILGADAYYKDEIVGQVAAIPSEYFLNGRKSRGLLAVNVAVHPKFQGRYLFKKLGLKMCEYAAEADYEFVIGVANKAATPGWVRQMGFQLVQPLEARIGLGSLYINWQNVSLQEHFSHVWSDKKLAWRIINPNNSVLLQRRDNKIQCYAHAIGSISAYAELPGSTMLPRCMSKKKFLFTPRLFLGLVPQGGCQFYNYKNIPQQFRPSPLNLIYRSLNQKVERLEKDHISFSFLDFDAY